MKLLSIKVLGKDFRSITAGKKYTFNFDEDNTTQKEQQLQPKCFIGLNGSGKSNMFELLSEIFFYLDGLQLQFDSKGFNTTANFGFEIEYLIPFKRDLPGVKRDSGWGFDNQYAQVKVSKRPKVTPTFHIKPLDKGTYEDVSINTHLLLPNKVIAYTSGTNEILSNAFYKMRYHYFNEYEQMREQDVSYAVGDSRLFFLDNNTNYYLTIANFLMGDEGKLKKIKKPVKIHELHSFRITIRYKNYKSNEVTIPKQLGTQIDRLKRCATAYNISGSGKNRILTIDFLVDDELKSAFGKTFDSSFDLFKVFYELDMLNINMTQVTTRELIRNPPKWLNISDEIPQPDPSKLIFRIDKVNIRKSKSGKIIKYKNLSDGEHQFLQVVGAVMMMEDDNNLFLLDEPETHFNPKWRSKLIRTLNEVSKKSSEADSGVRKQEIMISTHSPFILSDCRREHVYYATRKNDRLSLTLPKIETFGASVGQLMDHFFFEEPNSIARMARDEIEKIKSSIKQAKTERGLVNAINRLSQLGNSLEKLDTLYLLRNKELELKKSVDND